MISSLRRSLYCLFFSKFVFIFSVVFSLNSRADLQHSYCCYYRYILFIPEITLMGRFENSKDILGFFSPQLTTVEAIVDNGYLVIRIFTFRENQVTVN